MSNLTETAYYTRKIIKYGSISLVFFLILRAILLNAWAYWKKTHVPPPPPPNMAFGKIPAIKFPNSGTNPSFYPRLETVDNKLPTVPESMNVYFISQSASSYNFFTEERTKNWAKNIGFTLEPTKVDDYNFVYKTLGIPSTTLKLSILNGNFTISYDYQNDLTLVGLKNPPKEDQAIIEAKRFLQQANSLPSDLADGYQEVIFQKFIPPNVEAAIAFSEADFALVNFFRANINNYKIMPPYPKKSLVSVLISGSSDNQKRLLEINYTHYSINSTSTATYPLKKMEIAWEELQKNQVHLANFGQNFDGQVVIRKIYLAYFDPPDEQKFLEPIYVFEGDRDFIGYISALDPKFTEATSPTQNSQIPTQ
jgi:hypothetical protein